MGSDRDEYGCLPSGGYKWSQALEQCISLWEAGIEMLDTRIPTRTKTGYLIISPDKAKAEMFFPGKSTGLLLLKKDSIWLDEERIHVLSEWKKGSYQLKSINGALLYHTNQ